MYKLFGVLILVAVIGAASAQKHGAWEVVRNLDPITDEDRSFIYAIATNYPFDLPKASALFVRCSNAAWHTTGVEVFLITGTKLGSEDTYSFVYRVDKREPVDGRGNGSTSGESLFLQQPDIPTFFRELVAGSSLALRVSAFDGPLTYTVPVNGLSDALFALGCYRSPSL